MIWFLFIIWWFDFLKQRIKQHDFSMNALNVYVKCGCVCLVFLLCMRFSVRELGCFLLHFLHFHPIFSLSYSPISTCSYVLCVVLVSTICFPTLYYSACKSAVFNLSGVVVYDRVCVVCGCHHHHELKTHTHTHTLTVLTHTKANLEGRYNNTQRGLGKEKLTRGRVR